MHIIALTAINQVRMKNTLVKILIVFTFLLPTYNYSQSIVSTDDLNTLLGEWVGTLTYTDYGTNKPFTMPANLIVKRGKNNYQLILNINYPKEPNANSKDKIKISKDGTQLNKLDIKSKENLPNGQIQITTQYSGKDNGIKALIKNIYIIGNSTFIMRKEVKFEKSDDWLMRNEYKYSR
ncbi:MAG: hypothetical protein DA407_09790 [Bacteroidetes bacterium]|nr:MAG: hypothetical protein DA407_09790 [Bacteroidota bacterium]